MKKERLVEVGRGEVENVEGKRSVDRPVSRSMCARYLPVSRERALWSSESKSLRPTVRHQRLTPHTHVDLLLPIRDHRQLSHSIPGCLRPCTALHDKEGTRGSSSARQVRQALLRSLHASRQARELEKLYKTPQNLFELGRAFNYSLREHYSLREQRNREVPL
jgi:hypothetical protein